MLNSQQQELVLAPINCKVIGVAGAGTGKTTTIIHRVKHILDTYDTGGLLLITFTRAAATELKMRIAKEIDENKLRRLTIGTFHSVMGDFIRRYSKEIGLHSNVTILDESSNQFLFRSIMENNEEYERILKDFFDEAQLKAKHFNEITTLVSMLVNVSYPEELMTGNFREQTINTMKKRSRFFTCENTASMLTFLHQLFKDSLLESKNTNTITYDHILFLGYMLAESGLLDETRNRFIHTIVDEYQDTNRLQDSFITRVANNKLTLIGDIDQSIYEFRGGTPTLLEEHAKHALVYHLSYNYRSTQKILDVANRVIKNNTVGSHIRKSLESQNHTLAQKDVVFPIADTDFNESKYILYQINQIKEQTGCEYSDFAILIRSRMTLHSISKALNLAKLPVNDTTKMADFMKSSVVKDMLNYLKVFVNPKDVYAFIGIINAPKQGIGTETMKKLQAHAENHELGIVEYLLSSYPQEELTPKLKEKVKRFITNYQYVISKNEDNNFTLEDVCDYFIKHFEYKAWIDKLKDHARLNEHLLVFKNVLKEFEETYRKENANATLYDIASDFIFDMSQNSRENNKDGICLTTIHNAKGLEWKHVFVIGLEQENIPGNKIYDNADLESERRLLYVALTRAKETLFITAAHKRVTSQAQGTPSQFVQELSLQPIKVGY